MFHVIQREMSSFNRCVTCAHVGDHDCRLKAGQRRGKPHVFCLYSLKLFFILKIKCLIFLNMNSLEFQNPQTHECEAEGNWDRSHCGREKKKRQNERYRQDNGNDTNMHLEYSVRQMLHKQELTQEWHYEHEFLGKTQLRNLRNGEARAEAVINTRVHNLSGFYLKEWALYSKNMIPVNFTNLSFNSKTKSIVINMYSKRITYPEKLLLTKEACSFHIIATWP